MYPLGRGEQQRRIVEAFQILQETFRMLLSRAILLLKLRNLLAFGSKEQSEVLKLSEILHLHCSCLVPQWKNLGRLGRVSRSNRPQTRF
jgi:hypothetical protein